MYQLPNTQQIEVFRTEHGVVFQCNRNNNLLVEFGGKRSVFKVTNFLDFVRRVNAIDIDDMVNSTGRHADIALLMPHYTEHCYLLDLQAAIRLKDLLNGAKAMLQLNSMLRECLTQYA